MDIKELKKLFRNVDKKYFVLDENIVMFKTLDNELYDLTSPTFWNNFSWVKRLNLNPEAQKLYNEIGSGLKENFLTEWRLKVKYDSEPNDLSWLNLDVVQKIGSKRRKRKVHYLKF